MHHDHVLKQSNFDLLTPFPGSGCGVLQAKYLVPYCCIHDSLLFDIQHDHALKKWNFDLLTSSSGSGGWGSACKIFATMLLYFAIPFILMCYMRMF